MLYFTICFIASTLGAICGIGGGVIIKPVLDATNTLSVVAISFLSGCTVLAMTSYSVLCDRISKKQSISMRICVPLAVGAAVGGILGKRLFSIIVASSSNQSQVGLIQAICAE